MKSTLTQDQSQKSVNAGVSYGNNAVQVSAGHSQNQNAIIQTTHTNSQILAQNLNLASKGDTNIIGGNLKGSTVLMNVGGNLVMETVQDTYEETGDGFGISIGGGKFSAGSTGKTGGIQNIGINASYKDIFKTTTGEKAGISAASSTVNVAGSTTDLTDKADRQFVNGDFEGGISVPTAIFTSKGREQIAKEYAGYKNLIANLPKASTYKDYAFGNPDPLAHSKARQAYYNDVAGSGAAFTGITLTELYQGVKYSIYNEGYNTFSTEYWKDSGQDIREAINASNGIIQPGFQSKADLDKFNEMLFSKPNVKKDSSN